MTSPNFEDAERELRRVEEQDGKLRRYPIGSEVEVYRGDKLGRTDRGRIRAVDLRPPHTITIELFDGGTVRDHECQIRRIR